MVVVDFGKYPTECLNGGGGTVERREATLSSGLKAWTLEPGWLCGFQSWLYNVLPGYPGQVT